MAGRVARVYAEAWYEAVLDEENVSQAWKEAKMVLELLKAYPDWWNLLKTPGLSADEKERLLEQVADACTGAGYAMPQTLRNLLKLLVKNRHAEELAAVLWQGISYCKKSCGIGSAVVTSATELRQDQKKQVETRLLAITGHREMEIEYLCDRRLIGGLVIQMEDRLADGSVCTRIRRLVQDLGKK